MFINTLALNVLFSYRNRNICLSCIALANNLKWNYVNYLVIIIKFGYRKFSFFCRIIDAELFEFWAKDNNFNTLNWQNVLAFYYRKSSSKGTS